MACQQRTLGLARARARANYFDFFAVILSKPIVQFEFLSRPTIGDKPVATGP